MGIVILDKELQAEIDWVKKEVYRRGTRLEFYSKFEWFDPRDDYDESLIKGG